jgi:hypothetical protein
VRRERERGGGGGRAATTRRKCRVSKTGLEELCKFHEGGPFVVDVEQPFTFGQVLRRFGRHLKQEDLAVYTVSLVCLIVSWERVEEEVGYLC